MLSGFCKKKITAKVDICIMFFFKLLINQLLSMSIIITKNNVKFAMKNKKNIFPLKLQTETHNY